MRRTRSSNKSVAKNKSTPKQQTKNNKKQAIASKPIKVTPQIRSRSQGKDKPQSSESGQSQTAVAFEKGTYVAFIDPSDNLETFKIALLIDDLRDVDEDVMVDIFQEIAPLTFKKIANKQPLLEHYIISDINVSQDKQAKKNTVQVKITRQQQNKIEKLMPSVVEKLQASSQSDNDEEDDEDDEESEKESEEEEEKESIEQIKNRRMVKAQPRKSSKGDIAPSRESRSKSKIPQTQAQSKSKKVATVSPQKSKQAKPAAKKGKKSAEEKKSIEVEVDEEMEIELEEEEESIEVINTSSKKKPIIVQKKSKSLTQVISKVGKKRTRKSVERDEASEEDNSGSQGDDEVAVKKRKVSKGKSQVVKTPKKKVVKAPKRPTEFKKGRWNPEIDLIDEDKYKESNENQLYLECCIRCNNKNIIRAVNAESEPLLKKGIEQVKKISLLNAQWSPDVKKSSLDYIASKNLHKMLELLLHPKISHIPAFSTYDAERNNNFNSRVGNPPYLMSFVDSGMVSNMAYGTRVRRVQMTRGNRQGNNAFMEYTDEQTKNLLSYVSSEQFLRGMLYTHSVEVETLKMLIKLCPQVENQINTLVYEAVRAGNREIAFELVKNLVKHQNWGFNQMHCDVLGEDDNLGKILRVSTQKKCNTNKDFTPLHCAAINPNENFLKQLIDANPDFNVIDQEQRRPIHYAAACVGDGPIRLLIAKGASLTDYDNQKMSCLHVACFTGRHENVRAILEHTPQLLNIKNKKSMNAMAYACKFGFTKCVEVLLEFKAKVNFGCGIERMTPLGWAATYGHYDLCEFLLDKKARVLSKDKYKRTPLIMAARNGHSKILTLLLQRGSEWYHTDSSMNTALHYAAAYGWLECMDILLKAGADVNAQNSWKITPINIAMLLNHIGCVKRLLDEPNVDVNGKDEKGRTLLILSMLQLDEESHDFIKYLLSKGANPNIADLEGQSPLHYIAKYDPHQHIAQFLVDKKEQYEKQVAIQKEVATLLINNSADLTLKDNNEQTPFALCLECDNAPLLELLQDKISLNKEPELFFAFTSKIFNEKYQKILHTIILNDPPTKDTINTLDQEGMTPFLRYIFSFSQEYFNLLTQITYRVNAQAFTKGSDKSQYKITNEDIFDKLADGTNFYSYHLNINDEQKTIIAKEFLEKIILQPFMKIMDFLIKNGADPQAKVQKLKKHRDAEMHKRVLAQLSEGDKIKMEEEKKKEKEKIKTGAERLKEQAASRHTGRGKPARKAARRGYMNYQQAQQPAGYFVGSMAYQNNQEQPDVYDTRNGEKVLRQYGDYGLQNSLHLVLKTPVPSLFNYILGLNVDTDEPDYDGVTLFNLLSKKPCLDYFEQTFNTLIKKDVRIDFPDIKGRTPFLNYYEVRDLDYSYKMLDLGANVNQMDASGLFALKYALIRRENDEIEKLLGRGANINQIDNKGRNLLHHAVNMSSATADATFETEQFLIDRGVELNLKDDRSRTPLHYAFVKISKWRESSQIDPIETVSSLCGCKGLEIDVQDKWLKTPLHYAAQRGASICSIYLIKRFADLEKKDIYGNTALGVSLLNQHYNYGIILIQNQIAASVNPLVFKEDPVKIQKKWDEEVRLLNAMKKKQNGNGKKPQFLEDDEMEVDDENKDQKTSQKKKHRDLFISNQNVFHDEDEDEDDYGDEYDDEEQELQMQQEMIFNQQNAFGMSVFSNAGGAQPSFAFGQVNMFGGAMKTMAQPAAMSSAFNNGNPSVQNQLQQQLDAGYLPKDDEGLSMFKLAIRGAQQGLAYLMIDNGYPLMLAIQDAMDEKKFLLVLTLLSKNPDDEVIQKKNNKEQNLFHILSMNASGCNYIHLERIYTTLKKRGVGIRDKDVFTRNALHYAVQCESLPLVKLLFEREEKYPINEIDIDEHTPLSICLQGTKGASSFYNRIFPVENIFYFLVKNGADVNYVYPEKCFKPGFKTEEVDEEKYNDYNPKGKYTCSFLINVIRQQSDRPTMEQNIIGLIENGAKMNVVDSDSKDAIMYAIQQDNLPLLKLILDNKNAISVNKECQDKTGKSACHYVVNPARFGSYENVDILKLLHTHNFNLKLKDANQRIPIQYAAEQESGKLYNELMKLGGQARDINKLQRAMSMITSNEWPQPKVDFEQDSDTFMTLAHEKEIAEHIENKNKIPVDTTGKFEKSYEVYYDENKKPWDVYLTKVDLKNGIYGDYVFYKMQLLYDTNRDLYVVFTRWGRIGEEGMNQRTPFNNVEEAKIDFKKIFKQKTGGNNFEELETFAREKKKYTLAKVNYVTTNFKEYLQPFDFDKCPKTRLQKQVYELLEEISNVTMYQRAMNDFGIDKNVMPFSAVSKESIIQAKNLLMEIVETLKEDTELSKQGIKADYEKLQEIKEKISELSSRYYEMIPLAQYANQIAPPINNQHSIKLQFDNLESLTNIEFASKMLLGALYKQNEMNPVDYVHNALNLLIEPLDKEGAEFEVINTYIKNTKTDQPQNYYGNQIKYEIENIFKIQRKGEAEMISAYKEVPNHFLLYHGSMLCNFLGILSQGLRIAPPEAPPTGYMFGKGVYFADMFDKSAAYSQRGYAQQDSHLMMLSEVALGKSKELYNAEYVERLEPQYHSVKGVGRKGPGYDHTLVLPNGVKIPYGKVEDYYSQDPNMARTVQLQHNEYIVYNTSQIRMRYLVQIKKVDPNAKK